MTVKLLLIHVMEEQELDMIQQVFVGDIKQNTCPKEE